MKNILTVFSISLALLFWFIPAGSLFQTFMPRSTCMYHESRLIIMHGIADSVIFASYVSLSICLFIVYRIIKERKIPLKGFIWMFGVFIMFCGLTHFIGVLNLYVTFYWLDGAVKIICAIFSGLVAINFLPAVSIIKEIKSNEEYHALENKYDQLKVRLDKIENK